MPRLTYYQKGDERAYLDTFDLIICPTCQKGFKSARGIAAHYALHKGISPKVRIPGRPFKKQSFWIRFIKWLRSY